MHSAVGISAVHGGEDVNALLFLLAGAAKILGPSPFLEHMSRFSVPGLLLPAVIALELGAGLCLLVGWRVRWAAGALAIFCVMTAMIFHHQLGISAERTSFFKDLAIAGGLLCIAASVRTRTGLQ
jgi:putative oxidoreductase